MTEPRHIENYPVVPPVASQTMDWHCRQLPGALVVCEREQLRGLLERVAESFSMMPHLNAAIPSNIRDVRQEVNASLDCFWDDLMSALTTSTKETP